MAAAKTPARKAREEEKPGLSAAASEFAEFLLKVLDEKRAEGIVRLDVTSVTDLADLFIIATVANQRQASVIVVTAEKERKKRKLPRIGIDGASGSSWTVLDYGSIVVHLLTPEARRYYGLEDLWADARRI